MAHRLNSRVFIGCMSTALAVVLLVVVSIVVLRFRSTSRFRAVEEHLAAHRNTLIEDVRMTIDSQASGKGVPVAQLPASLAAPGVQYAVCGTSHLSLIVRTSPDTQAGFRIWISGPMEGYTERPTTIPNVFEFSYCNDFPESPTNRLP